MKLIHKQTGKIVREGDTVTDFRGEEGIVLGWTKPHSPASTGRVTVDVLGNEHHCYPEVYFCEWIDREDRLEEPQIKFNQDEFCERCGQTLHAPIHCGTCGAFDHPFTLNGYMTLGHGGDIQPQPTPVGGFKDFKPDWPSLEVFPEAPIKPSYGGTSSLPPVSSFDRTAQLMAEVEDELNRIQETLQQIKTLLS